MATLTLTKVWVHLLSSGEGVSGYSKDRSQSHQMAGDVRTYAGGRQRAISTLGTKGVFNFSLRQLTLTDIEILKGWIGQTVVVRDHRGQIFYGTYYEVTPDEWKEAAYYDVAIPLKVVTVNEEVIDDVAGFEQLVDTQVFETSGTWVKPSWATATSDVSVLAIGSGTGGGSGRKGAAGTVRCGGGGGGGGAVRRTTFKGEELPALVTVTIGNAGTGGAAVSASDTDGASGGFGADCTFGPYFGAEAGGSAGGGGTASAGTAGLSWLGSTQTNTGAGGAASGTGGNGGGTNRAAQSACGGAAGGGITSANVASNGGASNFSLEGNTTGSNAGGIAGGATPSPGPHQTPTFGGCGGWGGPGGAGSTTGNGQDGAAGRKYGGGGGGGGAAVNAVGNSGAGGAGAAGVIIVVTRQ